MTLDVSNTGEHDIKFYLGALGGATKITDIVGTLKVVDDTSIIETNGLQTDFTFKKGETAIAIIDDSKITTDDG